MAESNSCSEIPKSNMKILKEALHAQQQLLQKVYFELEEEREASSSAASEAMLKILRLQAEKAQVKMEASQYKREAEEKMCFAEESLSIFEDHMYQKEMEIANLEFQVQAYTNKLLGAGCSDLNIPEDQYPESPDLHRYEQEESESGSQWSATTNTRRMSVDRVIPNLLQKKAGGALNAYREQIRKLGEQVNKISDDRFCQRTGRASRNRFRSCSVPPPNVEQDSASSPPKQGVVTTSDLPNITKILVGRQATSNTSSPSNVNNLI